LSSGTSTQRVWSIDGAYRDKFQNECKGVRIEYREFEKCSRIFWGSAKRFPLPPSMGPFFPEFEPASRTALGDAKSCFCKLAAPGVAVGLDEQSKTGDGRRWWPASTLTSTSRKCSFCELIVE
jgi:hypothetical protein